MNALDDSDSAIIAANNALKKRRAMKRGDTGSYNPEPAEVSVPECLGCADPLYDSNRSGIHGICIPCLTQRNARAATIQAERKVMEDNKAGRSAMWIIPAIAAIMGIAWLLGQAGGKMCFWIGGLFQ